MKHAASIIWDTVEDSEPKHSKGWTAFGVVRDRHTGTYWMHTPGKHAKPFAKHHPARPVTYNATGTTTPLNPPTHALDAVA